MLTLLVLHLILTHVALLGHRSAANDDNTWKYFKNQDVTSLNVHKHTGLFIRMAEPAIHGAGVVAAPEHADGDTLPVQPTSPKKVQEIEPAKSEDDARLEKVLQSDVGDKEEMQSWRAYRPF